jgi:hypothetical protein
VGSPTVNKSQSPVRYFCPTKIGQAPKLYQKIKYMQKNNIIREIKQLKSLYPKPNC